MKIQTKTREVSIWDILISREQNETAIKPYDAFYICQKLNRLITEMNPKILIEFDSDSCGDISADITIKYNEDFFEEPTQYINAGKWESLKEFKKRLPKQLKRFLDKLDKKTIKL